MVTLHDMKGDERLVAPDAIAEVEASGPIIVSTDGSLPDGVLIEVSFEGAPSGIVYGSRIQWKANRGATIVIESVADVREALRGSSRPRGLPRALGPEGDP